MPSLFELLTEFQSSSIGVTVRGLGGWGYALINLFHLLGVAVLGGAVLLMDLRLMGWRRHIPLAYVTSLALPVAISGFILAVMTGILLLSANASDYAGNPFLWIKFFGLLFALANAWWAHQIPAWKNRRQMELTDSDNAALALAGFGSLVCWIVVISAGRLIGYW
ncbi:DUF6644 family protein [Cellvibrio mixtus]|uniref:DUF6644 family protein n=1 Tax=Cellvibrio mixtus TaxID=39650 RepID=UPI0006933ACA|nr:DUF6644 family protein [Cellvibrio mixtus]